MSAAPCQPDVNPDPLDVPVDRPEDYHLVCVDLFCGGGGFSTGLVGAIVDRNYQVIAAETGLEAEQIDYHHPAVQGWLERNVYLVGINHWQPAVDTYRENHPWARVLNAKVQAVHPPDAVTVCVDGEQHVLEVDVLIAGPSCVPWSKAKGGMASSDQLRMSPRHVAWWLELLRPTHFLLENVEGIQKWGPMEINDDGERTMRKDGSMFEDWLETLRRLQYSVAYDTFVASDYGDPQSRKRLFVMGRLDYEPVFPTPTHGPEADQPHRPAADIIDWSDAGMSVWTRDRDHPRVHKTLKYTTMQRIAEGLRRHCDERFAPFADALDDIGRVTDSDDVDADAFRSVETLRENAVPLEDLEAALETREKPFLVRAPGIQFDGDRAERHGLCVPYLLGQHGGSVPRDATERPTPTVATDGAISLVAPEPLVLPRNGRQRGAFSNRMYPADREPLHTITAHNHDGHLVSPYLVPFYGERSGQAARSHDLEAPLPTVPASKVPAGVVNPFLVSYYNNSTATSVEESVPTVTTRDRHALIVPEALPWGLDIHFRMLKPAELKKAQGFPDSYALAAGTKRTKTKLIGNAVPVNLARSLCRNLLEPTPRPTLNQYGDAPQPAADTGGAADDD